MSSEQSRSRHASAEDVLRTVSIEDACRANGIRIVKGNLILCPAHPVKMGKRNTNYGNCNIYKDTNTFTCHSCHTTGNVISLTMYAQDMPYSEAIDYLAAQCAPWLLSESTKFQAKPVKQCPFDVEELEDLGLQVTGRDILSIAKAPNKYAVTHEAEDGEYDWTLEEYSMLSDSGAIIGKRLHRMVEDDIVLCKSETVDIRDFYREDPQAFREMVIGKAKDFLLQYPKQMESIRMAAGGDNALTTEIRKILEQKKESAWHVIRYYRKVDRETQLAAS